MVIAMSHRLPQNNGQKMDMDNQGHRVAGGERELPARHDMCFNPTWELGITFGMERGGRALEGTGSGGETIFAFSISTD